MGEISTFYSCPIENCLENLLHVCYQLFIPDIETDLRNIENNLTLQIKGNTHIIYFKVGKEYKLAIYRRRIVND